MNIPYFKSDVLIKEISFLIGAGFQIIEIRDDIMGTVVEYSNDNYKIQLAFDYKEYLFFFYIIRGIETIIMNGVDFTNIKDFWDLALKDSPDYDLKKLTPNRDVDIMVTLKENSDLLKNKGL
ncbi:hypothetical protein [Emticicia sp. 21SJ11W-3]|uniref:hypothetical protein n=1 Tax=Emticicia sp. 21SJ11W-3 TaxID=2916755 RepID=UPI0020A202EE|nr:hypothetical protein [Emticicia sp. 21SJ11W-3]UTA66376.1 hypothetical protein MB380_12265 [Emticicia sp. 21SJ11W-3]